MKLENGKIGIVENRATNLLFSALHFKRIQIIPIYNF